MNILLPIIIAASGFFHAEESLNSVNVTYGLTTEIIVSEVVATEAVQTEVMEAVETEAVQAEVVETEASDIDHVTTAWSQLDPATQAAILMLIEADRMTHVN